MLIVRKSGRRKVGKRCVVLTGVWVVEVLVYGEVGKICGSYVHLGCYRVRVDEVRKSERR